MDDVADVHLRQDVEIWLQRAMAQLKLVKDENFSKPLEEKLKQLNDFMRMNQRKSTLEECRKLIHMACRKTFSKLVLENHTNMNTSAIPTTLYSSSNSEPAGNVSESCIPPTAQLAVETEQRLALKYPRRKICASESSATNIANSTGETSKSLFKRRHELFAPASQAATYGEHKRMLQLQDEAKIQNKQKIATVIQVSAKNNDKSYDKDLPKTEPQSVHAAIYNEATSLNSTPNLCKNSHNAGGQLPTDSRNDMRELLETANKTTQQSSGNDGSTEDITTNDNTIGQVIETVEMSKPVKPSHKTKNKINHRELHDLLSYTTEIFPKLSRRKSISINEDRTTAIFPKLSRRKSVSIEEDRNMQLLKQYGITKKVQIVLKRIEVVPVQIVHRTRSKSIDSMKYLKIQEAAQQIDPVHNKISDRRESISMETKKQTTATSTIPKKTIPTARKSVSKPQKNVQSMNSSQHHIGIKNVINNVTTEKEQKVATPKTASVKRTRCSPSPPPAKRTRSSINDSNNIRAIEKGVQNSDEDSDQDERTILSPNVAMNQNPPPNNDPKVHCRSDYMEKCCLCSYNGEQMVQHYVYNHPKKTVYVSRIEPEQAKLIRADPYGISGRKAVSRYGDHEIIVFRCHFCDLQLSESQELWLDHISKHTGEYRYKCMLCPTFARIPFDKVTHHSVCTKPSMQLWHTYTFEENHLYAYMCNKCNFVQVLFVNMTRHLREDHPEVGSIKVGYIKFSLVNFNLQNEDIELPYGMVKLEPILDDTNISTQVEQEVELTLSNECQTPLRTIVQEQDLLRPEPILIKQEILTDRIDQYETNHLSSIVKKARDVSATFLKLKPQERSQYSCNVRIERLPADIVSLTDNNTSDKASRNDNPVKPQEGSQCSRIVRVKKLPGDILSAVDNNISDKASRNNIPVYNASSYSNQLKHSTNNAGSKKPANSTVVCLQNDQRTVSSSMVALQPWNESDVSKRMIERSKLTVLFLTASYKCTAYNCGFYTETSQTIGSHFQNHQKLASSHQPIARDSSWLECCFCKYVSLSVHNLLKHVETIHKYSAYQCDRCCYRSRDPNSVRVHQRNYHIEHDADAKILCIPGRQKEYNSVDRDIIMNELKSNVKMLKCTNCPSRKFNDLEQYRNHIKSHGDTYIACHVCDQLMSAKKIISHINSHNMFMIQCIYCDYGINDLKIIKKHVADKHSDKLLCYHIRCCKPNVPPFIRVQDRISPERFLNC
ncbi:uncharacterized protein LOC128309380 [Anopheles moucheti]|uniref:uncharacterized protein LOC128309380 n=1 Tax=Anopheles moucheti TaxID=186751 RepID=UPI0022F0D557|nr:uncharacterized protein LOC128309380 [Anopheles moucheti]